MHPRDSYPTISLCMIARDEEDWVQQCIESVLPVVSEIILVDTGSTDRTAAIAEELGALVLKRAWDDDFSAPRNLSLAHATKDWILVLDADETIDESDHEELRQLTLDRTKCYSFTQRHYSNDQRMSAYRPAVGEYPKWEKGHGGFFESALVRLIPNHCGLEYQGRIHELFEHSVRQKGMHEIVHSRIPIHHYGHTKRVRQKKNKAAIYTPLGQRKLHDDPEHWQNYFELGVEHNVNGKHKESVEAFQIAIKKNPYYVPSWTNLGYVLCQMGNYQAAVKVLLNAIKLDSQAHEAYCNLGVVYMRAGDYPKAEQVLMHAVQINEHYVNAMCNLGKTLAYQNRLSEAVHVFKRAIGLLPQCTTAKMDLGAIYVSASQFDQAERYLKEVIEEEPELGNAYFNLAQVYKATGRNNAALEALEKFCESGEEIPPSMRAQAEREIGHLRGSLS